MVTLLVARQTKYDIARVSQFFFPSSVYIHRKLYYKYKYINCTKVLTLDVEFKIIKNRKEFFFFCITKILASQAKDNVDVQHENFFLMRRFVKILL